MMTRLLDTGIGVCLIITLAAQVYGHMDASACGLSLRDSYITEYMKMAPHWPWLILAAFAFAMLLFLLAMAWLRHAEGRPLLAAGCLLLSATAMANFFVAYAPMRSVEQPPPPAHAWWTPAWWFTSHAARNDYEQGMAAAYSDVHYRAIRLVVASGMAGMFCLGTGCVGVPRWRFFVIATWAGVPLMSVLFLLTDHVPHFHGLWQRLGFALMYAWLWTAWLHCRSSRGHVLPRSRTAKALHDFPPCHTL
ncbi:MAG: hypothetical protein ACO1TE_18480 [Prosthecobacter sp.]